MHTEHKTLKWCAVLLTLIIAIAVVTMISLQTVPAGAPVTVEVEGVEKEAGETAVIKALPEEMSDLITDYTPEILKEEYEKNSIAHDETDAVVKSAAPVGIVIKADGMEMHLMAAPATVRTALEAYGIPVGKDDLVEPELNASVTEGTKITVKRITFEEVVKTELIPFKTKTRGTEDLPAGTKKVVQKGQKGEDKVTYKITYADGEEIARKEISRETVKKPVTKIIEKSTVGTVNGAEYTKKFTVKAYSYTGGGRTASGLPAAVGRIAVDPSVIPLGTRVYVEGYGFATAADTGGNIKGKTIDVYYNSAGQCRKWGCRHVTVYILK